jgi:hypothetical protein
MFFFYAEPEDYVTRLWQQASRNTKLFFIQPRGEIKILKDKSPYEFTKSHRIAYKYIEEQRRRDAKAKIEAAKWDKTEPVIDADYDVPGADLEASFKNLAELLSYVSNSPISAILDKYYNGDKEKISKHIEVKCPMCEVGIPKTLVSIKPDQPPMGLSHGVSQGIEPTHQSSYRMRKIAETEWQRTYANPIGKEIVLEKVYESALHPNPTPMCFDETFKQPDSSPELWNTVLNPSITAHAGNPAFQDLRWDKEMDALRDTTVKVELPEELQADTPVIVIDKK